MNNSALSSLSAIPKKQLVAPPNQPTRHIYDVVVLGRQPGGLLAGALLAKRGLTVLQLDPLGQAPYYAKEGALFPIGPSLTPSIKSFARLEPALFELGINLDLCRYQEAHGHALQLIRGRLRFDHTQNDADLRNEARRCFPENADEICSVFSHLADGAETTNAFFNAPIPFPPKGFWDRFRLRRPIRELLLSTPVPEDGLPALPSGAPTTPTARLFQNCLSPLTGFVTGFEEDNELGDTRETAHLIRGIYGIPGGSLGVGIKLGQRMLELGSDVLGCADRSTELEEIDFTFSKLSSIRLLNSDSVIRASSCICAMDAEDFARLPIPEKYASRMLRFAAPLEEEKRCFVFSLLVRKNALPCGLSSRAIVFSQKMPELGGILIETSQARTESSSLDGCAVLTAMIRVRKSDMDTPDKAHAIAAALRTVLTEELCPFLDRHILQETIPALDAGPFSPPMAVTYKKPPKSYLGLMGLPVCTPFRNVFLANRQVLPALGLEGELLAGIRVADLVQRKLRKYNPLK